MKVVIFIVFVVFSSLNLLAAPSLQITEPPVTDTWDFTGPTADPDAFQGQWISNLDKSVEQFRPYEFYDNVAPEGGGTSDFTAIFGQVVSIIYAAGAGTNILAFDISAVITNDTQPFSPPWSPGSNSHGENLATGDQYEGIMYNTLLTADFAISDLTNLPLPWASPYFQITPYIIANNEDALAWYCWTPENPEPALLPWGDYYVPAWRFGNIAPGGNAGNILSFSVDGAGLPPTDSRYAPIVNSFDFGEDIFMNRTTSLKISDWLETLTIDGPVPYPTPPNLSSDVSVFHNEFDDPLPITLSSFNAQYASGNAILNWTTQSELENQGWNIYRSNSESLAQSMQINEEGIIPGAGTTSEPTVYTYTDEHETTFNTTYWYWLESIDFAGNAEIYGPITMRTPIEDPNSNPILPTEYGLFQNCPNPFNPNTEISFRLSEDTAVELTIFNAKGRRVTTLMNAYQVAADQLNTIIWNGKDSSGKEVSSGIYFYKLSYEDKTETRRMLLVK